MKKGNAIKKEALIIGLAGDSGDGIQLIGLQLTYSFAEAGKSVNALPDYPAEIRAPAGTVAGVSSYQLKISDHDSYTPGNNIDILFAMNPAALKNHLIKLSANALIIINSDTFDESGMKKASLHPDYLLSSEFNGYTLHQVPVNRLTKESLSLQKLSHADVTKAKNMFVLGIIAWLTGARVDLIIKQIQAKFKASNPALVTNEIVFNSGYHYAETAEIFYNRYIINPSSLKKNHNPGSGNKAFSDACLAIFLKSNRKLFISGYPITPASTLIQHIAKFQYEYGLRFFQAEDEISSISAAIGAAFGGYLGLTVTSGPGFDLKTEALGLAIITELPLVILNVQRAGPSTGMPTKTEQSDLNAAIYGRHGESSLPVLAPCSPADCYTILFEAFEIAVKFMTPVIILSDAYLSNAVENISLKPLNQLPDMEPLHEYDAATYQPYSRLNSDLKRPWAVPGMLGFEHCLGGLEKAAITGAVSYEAENHQHMVTLRQNKIEKTAIPVSKEYFYGDESGDVLLIGWGSSYGAIKEALQFLQKMNINVSMLHIRHIFPLPTGLGNVILKFKKTFIIEQNSGHLANLIRAKTLMNVEQYNIIDGLPVNSEKLSSFLIEQLTSEVNKDVLCR